MVHDRLQTKVQVVPSPVAVIYLSSPMVTHVLLLNNKESVASKCRNEERLDHRYQFILNCKLSIFFLDGSWSVGQRGSQ